MTHTSPREEMTPTTPEEARRRRDADAQALRAAMDAVANPTRVDASTPTPAKVQDDEEDAAPSKAPLASSTTANTPPDSTPTTDEASPASTIAPSGTGLIVVAAGTVDSTRAIVVSSPSELPNENGTKRPMVTVTDEEVANLEAYLQSGFGLVHDDGRDGDGRRVLVVNATRVPGWAGSADRDAALRLITKALTRAGAEGEYVLVVYFGDDDRTKGVVPSHTLGWLRDMHEGLERETRKNVTRIVFVNASWFTGALISWTMTFTSSKTREKFVWVNSLHTMEKESGFFVNPAMCGEAFLRSVRYAPQTEASS